MILMVFFADDSPVNVSLKFSEVDFPEDCGGINMTICRDALVEQISRLAGIPEERLSPLRLEEGMKILYCYRLTQREPQDEHIVC